MNTNLVAVQMELTNACKLKCAECPRILMSRPVGVMDLELAKLIVADGVAYNPRIGFNVNGLGEPLLYPHFPEIVEFMGQRGARHIDLFTSLIAPTRMVEPAFEALEKARVHVTVVVTKHFYDNEGNRQFDDDIFDLHLMMALRLGRHAEKHIGLVANKFHTAADIEQFTAKYSPKVPASNFHVIRQLNPWFNLVKDMAHPEFGADPDQTSRNICDYPFILLHVGWDGRVIICCTDDVDGECILGKIEKPGDLRSVWHGPALEHIRTQHRNYVIDMKPCDKCSRTAWARL